MRAGAHGIRRHTRIEHSGCNDSVVVHPRREQGDCLGEHQRSTIAHHRLEHFACRLLLESSFAIQTESVKGLAVREPPACRVASKKSATNFRAKCRDQSRPDRVAKVWHSAYLCSICAGKKCNPTAYPPLTAARTMR